MQEPSTYKDPFKLKRLLWPDVKFYREERDIIQSVVDNDTTVVVAGNQLGKDFTAAFIVLWFFLTRYPCRVVTTSADYAQLEGVLWGEMRRYLQTSRIPLEAERGGPLVINHMHIRRLHRGTVCGVSYIKGRVAAKGEGMQGHHVSPTPGSPLDNVPRTLFVADEASGLDDDVYRMVDSWARRKLVIGNAWPCENFFKYAVKGRPNSEDRGGDLPRSNGGFHRKVLRIRAEDSPNVRLAMAEIARGESPSGRTLVQGVKTWEQYQHHRAIWDKHQQCVGLDADFYEGEEVKLYPAEQLAKSNSRYTSLQGAHRRAKAIGVDSGEGSAYTAMVAVDSLGVVEVVSKKTPDTSVVPGTVVAFALKHGVQPEDVCLDRGGGGKQHADRLRANGFNVRTVAFGEAVSPAPRRGHVSFSNRVLQKEMRYVYMNRRAEMYGELSVLLEEGFAVPASEAELLRQMAAIPKLFNDEGRLYIPPKGGQFSTTEGTLYKLLGRSPDELDALVLAVYAMQNKSARSVAGVR